MIREDARIAILPDIEKRGRRREGGQEGGEKPLREERRGLSMASGAHIN